MAIFLNSLIFIMAMISLTLSLATVKKNKADADLTMKLHIFLVQAIVVFSVLIMFCSLYVLLKGIFLLC